MQICKLKKLLASLIFIGSFTLWAQQFEMPSMPEMPSVSMPSMPTMGSTYYRPQMPGFNSYSGSTSSSKSSTNKSSTTTSTVTTPTTPAVSSLGTLNYLDSSNLSASDVSTLYNSGLFDSLSSLLGTGVTTTDNTSTNLLLQQILVSLNELKQQNGGIQNQNNSTVQSSVSDFKSRQPSVLRFKVNGNSLIDSFKTVFISESEPDGTFLLTADRVYYVNQKEYRETIYLLFKTKRNNGSTTVYTIIPTLMQDTYHQNSFLYRMSEQIDMEAQKTGNLVAAHVSKEQFSMDILIDLDN